MKVIIADCSAIYTGRGDTSLPRGVRAILLKRDGSVSLHNDVGNKPLNYMKNATFSEDVNVDDEIVWMFDSRRESLTITVHHQMMSTDVPLMDNDPGLVRDGTEDHLQEWLAENPHILGDGWHIVSREFETGNGPVDLLALDADNAPVAVEVKRVAMLPAVDQVRRYLDALRARSADTRAIPSDDESDNAQKASEAARKAPADARKPADSVSDSADPVDVKLAVASTNPMGTTTDDTFDGGEETTNRITCIDGSIVDVDFSRIRGMIAAVDIRPRTWKHAEKNNIAGLVIPADWREHETSRP